MGYLMSGAFATALLSVLLIYSGIITLEASIQEDTSSNEVNTSISNHLLFELNSKLLIQVNTGSLGSNLHHQYELEEAQQKIKLLESKLSMLESRIPQVGRFREI